MAKNSKSFLVQKVNQDIETKFGTPDSPYQIALEKRSQTGAEEGEDGGVREAGEGKDFREGSVWWRDVQSIVENVLGTFFIINIYI